MVLSCLYIAGTIQSKFINQTNDCNYAKERESAYLPQRALPFAEENKQTH